MDVKKDIKNDTGISWREWKKRSEAGELCGILGCFNKPVVKCEHCGNHYCKEHQAVIDTIAHATEYSQEDRR